MMYDVLISIFTNTKPNVFLHPSTGKKYRKYMNFTFSNYNIQNLKPYGKSNVNKI